VFLDGKELVEWEMGCFLVLSLSVEMDYVGKLFGVEIPMDVSSMTEKDLKCISSSPSEQVKRTSHHSLFSQSICLFLNWQIMKRMQEYNNLLQTESLQKKISQLEKNNEELERHQEETKKEVLEKIKRIQEEMQEKIANLEQRYV